MSKRERREFTKELIEKCIAAINLVSSVILITSKR